MGRLGLGPAGSLALALGEQIEKSLAIILIKLPMVIPIKGEQRGVNEQHGGGAF